MNKSIQKRMVAGVMAAVMVVGSLGTTSAVFANDLSGNWAEKAIKALSEKDVVKGYEDGSFKPNNNITRAEYVASINRALGFK